MSANKYNFFHFSVFLFLGKNGKIEKVAAVKEINWSAWFVCALKKMERTHVVIALVTVFFFAVLTRDI